MNKDYIVHMIDTIKALSELQDDAKAHSLEDALREVFITELSKRADEIGQLAKLVLSTKEIPFSRWTS